MPESVTAVRALVFAGGSCLLKCNLVGVELGSVPASVGRNVRLAKSIKRDLANNRLLVLVPSVQLQVFKTHLNRLEPKTLGLLYVYCRPDECTSSEFLQQSCVLAPMVTLTLVMFGIFLILALLSWNPMR